MKERDACGRQTYETYDYMKTLPLFSNLEPGHTLKTGSLQRVGT